MVECIYTKSQAQEKADKLAKIPDDVIIKVNDEIVQGYAEGVSQVTFGKQGCMNGPSWKALGKMLTDKGYKVKEMSEQRDGVWYIIEL